MSRPMAGGKCTGNRAKADDYVDLLAVIDTLSVPVICGIDTIPLNNYGPGSIRLQVFEASPSTKELVDVIQDRFGKFHAQKTPQELQDQRDSCSTRAKAKSGLCTGLLAEPGREDN